MKQLCTFNKWLIIVMVFSLNTGCATMQSHWKTAESSNTIAAYEEFLRRYPKGELSDQACSRLKHLKNLSNNINTVRIIVNESYKGSEKVNFPYLYLCERIMSYGGIRIIPGEAQKYDTTLRINFKGEFERGVYSQPKARISGIPVSIGGIKGRISGNISEARYYSKAKIKGNISLEGGKLFKFSGKAYEESTDPDMLHKKEKTAFILKVFDNSSFLSHLFEILIDIKGIEPVISALSDEDYYIREEAGETLVNIGSRGTGHLIAALTDNDSLARKGAEETLGKIIGDRSIIEHLKYSEEHIIKHVTEERIKKINDRIEQCKELHLSALIFINAFLIGLPAYDLRNHKEHSKVRNVLEWVVLCLGVMADFGFVIERIEYKEEIKTLQKELGFLQTLCGEREANEGEKNSVLSNN